MSGEILEFPSGACRAPAGPDTVHGIAEALYRKLNRRGALPRSAKPLPVRLDALCGVADETIWRLAIVAAAGSITPETAARLALRHTDETGAGRQTVPRRPRGPPGLYELSVSGYAPSSFAVRIGAADGGPWVASASTASYGRLLKVATDGRAIILLVGRTDAAGTSVRVVTTPSWQVTIVGRSVRPGWRSIQHVLVVGGLPRDIRTHSRVAAAIATRLRSNPDLVLLFKEPAQTRQGVIWDPDIVRILQLLSLAMPPLLRDGGRP